MCSRASLRSHQSHSTPRFVGAARPFRGTRGDRRTANSEHGPVRREEQLASDSQQRGNASSRPRSGGGGVVTASTTAEKPEVLEVLPDGIPDDLKRTPQWVTWRLESKGDGWTKVPYQVNGSRASTTSPSTWTTFDAALAEYQSGDADGVGFVFSKADDYVGIDLDHIDSPELSAWAAAIVQQLNSYLEKSPSGTGYHVIVRGTLPKGKRKRPPRRSVRPWALLHHDGASRRETASEAPNCDKLKSKRSTPSTLPTRRHPPLCQPPRQRRTPPPSPTMTRSRASKLPTKAARCGPETLVRTRRNPKRTSPCVV